MAYFFHHCGNCSPVLEFYVGENHEQYVMRRNREFNEALRAHPGNIQKWKDYIVFQVCSVEVV